MTYLRPDAKSQVTIEYDDNGTPVPVSYTHLFTQDFPVEAEIGRYYETPDYI